jgi:YVTN family beta-propeller protein
VTSEFSSGTVVAGCRIDGIVGRGGMGVVYRALQLSLERPVALKAIAPEFADDVMFRERFKRESRIAASIEHPNVIPVYEAGEGEGILYLVMRYVEGTDLGAVIDADHGLEPARACRILGQVAQALAAAHRRDLLHRDVKPPNVLIDDRDHAYLTDFGVARSAGASSGLTRTGAVVGTVDYLAPERIQEQGGDGRSDVYALGCVLFETLTGRVPFERDNEMAKMYAHLSAPVPSARELAPEVPEELDALTRRAMAKAPEERVPSAAAFAEELGELAKRAAATQPAPRPDLAAPAEPPPPRPSPPRRRRSLPLALGGAALVVVAAVLVLVLSGGGGSSGGDSDPAFRQVASTQLDPGPDGMAVDAAAGTVWVANNLTDEAVAVDAARLSQRKGVALGGEPDSVAVGFGSVWVTKTAADSVAQIDPASRTVTRTIPVGDEPEGIAVSDDFVWVVNGAGGSVTRIDGDGDVVGTTDVGVRPVQAAVAGDGVWITLSHQDRVVELDARTGEPIAGHVAKIQGQPRGIAFDGTRLWVAATGANDLASFRPEDPANVAHIDVPSPREVEIGLNAVWVTTGDDGHLVAIDPKARRQVARFAVGTPTFGVAVGGGAAWSAGSDGRLVEVKAK